jgi:arginyl-tRNA synthetase
MINEIRKNISELLTSAGVTGEVQLSTPPKTEMGDFAFGCFAIAKEDGKNPAEVATALAEKVDASKSTFVDEVKAFGPYVNFYINGKALAEGTLQHVADGFGSHDVGSGQKVLVEFAHPNTHKAFHIGHLRNILTGESISRLLTNAGYDIHRVNYQGDVGMHIAKALWGIDHLKEEFDAVQEADINERVGFLGKAYATGAQAFEDNEDAKKAIIENNAKIYSSDESIQDVYTTTRAWSLEYFDLVYERVGTKFERFYFESEVFNRGVDIVEEGVEKGIFKKSEGAIIYEGSKHDLHDRVFINSQGYATYEGKEMGLAELQLDEYKPDSIIHITGREQANYFQVVFEAIKELFGEKATKEQHVPYGWVTLKEGKMSSRSGKVVLGEWLLDEVEKKIREIMADSEVDNKEDLLKKISLGAVKYSMLKTGSQNDIVFDINESISTTGNSGPYLQYIVARIKSILRKAGDVSLGEIPEVHETEKQILLRLAEYPDMTLKAAEEFDPSKVAQHLFDIAQSFNTFYQACMVLDEDEAVKAFRVELITRVLIVMEQGLELLGIDTVEEM